MNLPKLLVLIGIASFITGCTAIGFVADVALNTVVEDAVCDDVSNCRAGSSSQGIPLIFTKAGIEQDAEMVKKLIDEVEKSKTQAKNIQVPMLPEQPKVVACKELVKGKQQCYPASYYKGMYQEAE